MSKIDLLLSKLKDNNTTNEKKINVECATDKSLEKKKKMTSLINIFIDNTGTFVKLDDLHKLSTSVNYKKKIEKYFSITYKTITGYIKTIKNYRYDYNNSLMFIPRFGLFNFDKKSSLNINITNKLQLCYDTIPETPFKWCGKYMGNQKIVVEHIMKTYFSDINFNKGNSGVILNLEAGQGKSFVAQKIIELLQVKTIIIVHNRTILLQWVKLLQELFPDNKIGQYYGIKKENGDIVVAVINSLLIDKMHYTAKLVLCDGKYVSTNIIPKNRIITPPKDFFKQFGFAVIDECHEYCATERREIFNKLHCPYMLGLSATPNEREDGMDKLVHWNLGDILDASKINGYSVEDIPFTGKVHMVKYHGSYNYTKLITTQTLEMTSVPLMINQLVLDPSRMFLIIKYISILRKSNHNIFIFADRRIFLQDIKNNLHNYGMLSSIIDTDAEYIKLQTYNNASRLVGGTTDKEMGDAELKSNIILTTYAFMGTGKSIPKMDAIILATPRKGKSKQYINRIFRLGSNYDIERQIIDIVDWSTPMKSQWYKRKKYYQEKKYPIIINTHKYADLDDEMKEINFTPVFINT
jgi:hypothetical protein